VELSEWLLLVGVLRSPDKMDLVEMAQ